MSRQSAAETWDTPAVDKTIRFRKLYNVSRYAPAAARRTIRRPREVVPSSHNVTPLFCACPCSLFVSEHFRRLSLALEAQWMHAGPGLLGSTSARRREPLTPAYLSCLVLGCPLIVIPTGSYSTIVQRSSAAGSISCRQVGSEQLVLGQLNGPY